MSQINIGSKCFKTPRGVKIYDTEAQRVENNVPTSTISHNQVAAMQCSRRKKIRVQNDDMLDRANTVRDRLRKKLEKKKSSSK